MSHYLKSCLPDIEQIVAKVKEVRQMEVAKGLKSIYIMTNGARPWVAELKEALHETGGWDLIASSRDLKLDWEQKYISQAVDMLIGQRAQVIIGNGVGPIFLSTFLVIENFYNSSSSSPAWRPISLCFAWSEVCHLKAIASGCEGHFHWYPATTYLENRFSILPFYLWGLMLFIQHFSLY